MTGRVGSCVSYRSPGGGGEPVAVSMSRLEAFSDGVIAVAITLLVLNLRVRGPGHGSLVAARPITEAD